MTEPLADVPGMLRVNAVVSYDQLFHRPWATRFARSSDARVHVVVAGRCVVACNGEPAMLEPNDVVVVPGREEHVPSDGFTQGARESRDVYAEALQRSNGTDETVPVARRLSGRTACGHRSTEGLRSA
jgi:hypothetical protein